MIVLDWTRPWTFIEELQHWLAWVETWVNSDSSREMEVVREECKERRKLNQFVVYADPDDGPL
jgi:dynein light intermediate chain 1